MFIYIKNISNVEADVPSGRKNTDGGGIPVEFGGVEGVGDGVVGNLGGPKAGGSRGVAVAERDDWPGVRFIDVPHDLVEYASDCDCRRRAQHLVPPESPSLRRPVFHLPLSSSLRFSSSG